METEIKNNIESKKKEENKIGNNKNFENNEERKKETENKDNNK